MLRLVVSAAAVCAPNAAISSARRSEPNFVTPSPVERAIEPASSRNKPPNDLLVKRITIKSRRYL